LFIVNRCQIIPPLAQGKFAKVIVIRSDTYSLSNQAGY
jgi:hypothetical protein